MRRLNKTARKIIHDALNDPIGFDGKKIAEISNKKCLESLKK